MNGQDRPVGPQPEFTEEALNKKFSYSFTRKQLIVLYNTLSPIQLPVADMRTGVLIGVLDEIRRTALQSINDDDYVKPAKEANSVKLN